MTKSHAFFLVAAVATMTACGDDYHRYRRGEGSSIVFGISERTDPATGTTVTTAGHDYLTLANRGGRSVTVDWVSDGDVCIHEELDRRIGRPHVGDGGRARFFGGQLPAEGLVIDANAPEEPNHEGRAFRAEEPLGFTVDHGFALPEIGSVRLPAPNPHLRIDTPAETGELGLDVTRDTPVSWSPSLIDDLIPPRGGERERVMVAFETDDDDDRGNQVRCFYDERDGAGVVPAKWLSLIGPPGTKGTVTYASHRQVEVYPRGGWLVYVVGAIVLREQRFVVNGPRSD